LAKPSEPGAPLLVVFHGLGMNGKNMAAFTGLAQRGPALGFAVVFPDGWDEVWDGGGRLPGRDGVDDPGFIRALVAALIAEGVARDGPVSLVGISNGALFAEHLGRHALLAVSGLVLVSGTTTKASRDGPPRPGQQAAVLCFEGTGDPTMPYEGGRIGGRGFLGMIAAHRARQRRETGDGRVAVAAERVALDSAAGNGGPAELSAEPLPPDRTDLPVTKLSSSAPGRPAVVLYRIEGGGHGWPGGPQEMPSRLIGPIPSELDATGIMLEMARAELGWPGPNASTT
jgi:polyhydroxybutyrate depolymerase